MQNTLRSGRLTVALVTLLASVTLLATPALAGSSGQSRSSGTTASVQWIEVGELPGIAGNVHTGDLFVDGSTRQASVYGSVVDWTCPPGELPNGGGGHGIEDGPPEESNCAEEGLRFISGDPADVTFTMDKKLNTATLTGFLTVSSHGPGGGVARPPVDMTLTGFGGVATSKFTDTYSDGTFSYRFSYTSTYRQATVAGRIGPMDFTDDADDQSAASMGTYKSMDRFRSR